MQSEKVYIDRNNPVFLKNMRLLKGLSREEAGKLFNLSRSSIEKLENGRGIVSNERLATFALGYGLSFDELMYIKAENFSANLPERRSRRFCTPNITKECRVLRQLREKKGLSQYELSTLCGYGEKIIGFYECGRKNLNRDLIQFIVEAMDYTMADFNNYMECDEQPKDIMDECLRMMKKLAPTPLKAVRSFLKEFAK